MQGVAALILDGYWDEAVFKVHLFESASHRADRRVGL
jgi:hypothetical protein